MSDKVELVFRLEADNGEFHTCEIISLFALDGRDYALLMNLDWQEADQDARTAVMRATQDGENGVMLRSIDDQNEFEFVVEGHLCNRHMSGFSALTLSSIRSEWKSQVLDGIVRRIGKTEGYPSTMLPWVWLYDPPFDLDGKLLGVFASGGADYAIVRLEREVPILGNRTAPNDSDEDDFLAFFEALDDEREHVGYALMRFSRQENGAIFGSIESDDEFERVMTDLRQAPPWAPPWINPDAASGQSDPADDPSERLSELKYAFSAGIAPRVGHADSYEIADVPIELARAPSRLIAYVKMAVALLPIGLRSRVPLVRPSDLTTEFFEQLKRWIGYAKWYEMVVWEDDDDPIIVRLEGSGLLCAPPSDYRGYDLFKILGIFEFDGCSYLILLNGYKDDISSPFVAAGYGLVRIIDNGKAAGLCDISSDEEFKCVTRYLREQASTGLDCRVGSASRQAKPEEQRGRFRSR
jgi:hypothetical protein